MNKAAANLRKHGVSFDETGSAFLDRLALSGLDPDHSMGESRYITLNTILAQRFVCLAPPPRFALPACGISNDLPSVFAGVVRWLVVPSEE